MSEPEWISVPSGAGDRVQAEVAVTKINGRLEAVGIKFSTTDGLRSAEVRQAVSGTLSKAVHLYAEKHPSKVPPLGGVARVVADAIAMLHYGHPDLDFAESYRRNDTDSWRREGEAVVEALERLGLLRDQP